MEIIEEISEHIGKIIAKVDTMTEALRKTNKIEDSEKKEADHSNVVKLLSDKIRYSCDILELLVYDELWR